MKTKKIPQRMCVVCREMKDKKSLFRLRINESGKVEYDPTGKLPGHGAYICKSMICIIKAKNKGFVQKALGAECAPKLFEDLTSNVD